MVRDSIPAVFLRARLARPHEASWPSRYRTGSFFQAPSAWSRQGARTGQLLVLPLRLLRVLQPDGPDLDYQSIQPLLPQLVAVRSRLPCDHITNSHPLDCGSHPRIPNSGGALLDGSQHGLD